MHERHPEPRSGARHHLVAEHRPAGRPPDLLDIGAAQAAGEHVDRLAGAGRLGCFAHGWLPGRI